MISIFSIVLFMFNGYVFGVSSLEGNGNLSLKLNVGDKVFLMGMLLVDNFGDVVLIYYV